MENKDEIREALHEVNKSLEKCIAELELHINLRMHSLGKREDFTTVQDKR